MSTPSAARNRLDLPAEIRLKVYRLLMPSIYPTKIELLKNGKSKTTDYAGTLSSQLLRVNRQTYEEAQPILYRDRSFLFAELAAFEAFSNNVGLSNIFVISHLKLDDYLFATKSDMMRTIKCIMVFTNLVDCALPFGGCFVPKYGNNPVGLAIRIMKSMKLFIKYHASLNHVVQGPAFTINQSMFTWHRDLHLLGYLDIGMIHIDLDAEMHLFEVEGRLRKLRLGFEWDEQW